MPMLISDGELRAFLTKLEGISEPFSMEQAHGRLGKNIPRRTLQRRLALLVERRQLIAEGERGGRRYRSIKPVLSHADRLSPIDLDAIPLSDAAREIRHRIARPSSMRHPVGYQAAFLADYEPNVSAYLQPDQLRRLAEMGQVMGDSQPAGTYLRKVMDRLLVDLSWNSSRLEGNTYSLLVTERLLELGETAEGKNATDAQMILNHKAAIEMLAERADEIGFNRYTLCNLHALLADIRYTEVTKDQVAVVASYQGKVEFMTASEPFRQIQGIEWLRRGDSIPSDVPSTRFANNGEWLNECAVSEEGSYLSDWFPSANRIELEEDVAGLGSYQRLLTVLFTECETTEDGEDESEVDDYIDRWKEGRFRLLK